MSLVLADVHCVLRLAHECTVHAIWEFSFVHKSIKMRDPGCAHAVRVLLLTGTVCAGIKFKSRCTVVHT